ncbi:MAG: chemotaxis protein CheD [Ginsengibacter sp.]
MPIAPTNEGNMGKYYLYPGKVFSSKKPHIVDTILGSCVAVFLWDPVLQFSCINHYMLPTWDKKGIASFKYGDVAIPELLHRMIAMGSNRENIKAKIFGGSEIGNSKGSFNIGKRNINLAHDLLKKEQVPIVSFSVGGSLGRKIIFYTSSGDVLISYIRHDIRDFDKQNTTLNLSEK